MARSKKVRQALELEKQYRRATKQLSRLEMKRTEAKKVLSQSEYAEYVRLLDEDVIQEFDDAN